jgi:uncharacterized membrane-anchored protein YhcB (DUF1043 family)
MNKNKSATIAEKLNEKNALESTVEAKPYYKYFTRYFLVILLVICLALSAALALLLHQSNQTQDLINHQLKPLQSKFSEQSHLLQTTQIITAILTDVKAEQLNQLHQQLSLQYKKLLLPNSASHSKYKQWFTDNNASKKSIMLIQDNFDGNEQDRVQTIVQLETLVDTIKLELATNNYDTKQQTLLLKAQYQLTDILTRLQSLGIKSSLEDFQGLRASMADLLSADFPKTLANRAKQNTKLMVLVNDFIQLEDSVLQSGFFKKWQEQLSLINDYRNQLEVQRVQIAIIIKNLSSNDARKNVNIEQHHGNIEKLLIQSQLPKDLFIIFTVVMSIIVMMLWLLLLAIKYSSRHNLNHINHAIENIANVEENNIKLKLSKNKGLFYSEETYFLVNKIKQINNSRYSENDYEALATNKQQLENQQNKMVDKIEQLEVALVLVQNNAKAAASSQLLLEQKRYHALNTSAIKQLQLLGTIASSNSKQVISLNNANQDNYLFQAYQQVRDMITRLRQISVNSYLQTEGAILTLSDIDIVALQQALLLNLSNKFALCHTQISIEIDEKIQSRVNADAELFAEMFRVYIDLLLLDQKNCHLTLRVQLVDKNDGQQLLYFSGEIESQNNFAQLPEVLKYFGEEIEQNNELAKYFMTLLSYQHGKNIHANLTEKGYELSFNLPLAVTSKIIVENYPIITLPKRPPDIKALVNHLTSNYPAMPIEVLLAVKSPIQYQRVQQILQATGLQVTLVVNELMLAKYWQSGRFAVLITEIPCSPFVEFNVDYVVNSNGKTALLRGVFSLGALSVIEPDSANFSHWVQGNLDIHGSPEKLLLAMQPWLNKQVNDNLISPLATKKLARTNRNPLPAESIKSQSFNFHCYIQHQGSLELAIYMLDEYTQENSQLMVKLSHEFSSNHSDNVAVIIDRLLVNSRILAASHLLQLCNDWKLTINAKGINNSFQPQIVLLKETQQAVNAINTYAKSMT